MSSEQTEALSECNKCGRRYPSAPAGHIHKCGNCPGTCYPLATPSPAPSDTLMEAETYRAMHEIARDLGYPSILEALEAAPPRGWTDCGNVGWCHAEGRCTRHTLRNTGGSHD